MRGRVTLIDSGSVQKKKKKGEKVCVCVHDLKNSSHEGKDEQDNGKLCEQTVAHKEIKLICN